MNPRAWLARVRLGYQNWCREQADRNEIERMSDRELWDIGLTRSDVDRIFDPEFSADLRNRGKF